MGMQLKEKSARLELDEYQDSSATAVHELISLSGFFSEFDHAEMAILVPWFEACSAPAGRTRRE